MSIVSDLPVVPPVPVMPGTCTCNECIAVLATAWADAIQPLTAPF